MLRVGSVPYLVARPLDQGLEHEHGIELVRDVPARLVELLRDARLDVALVSSIELFRAPGYRYLGGLGVAGLGHVSSVQVFLRAPLAEVRSLALDPASRASAALVQVVWPGRTEAHPRFFEPPDGADPRCVAADAWLRIGDVALRESLAPDAPKTFNPAAEWHQLTGLPFLFALWIVRPGVDVEPWIPAFVRARVRGASEVGRLASEAARAWNLPIFATRHYLEQECLYEPGERMAAILEAFRDSAARLGLCSAGLDPAPIPLEAGLFQSS
jgi:chorismate dehydratase